MKPEAPNLDGGAERWGGDSVTLDGYEFLCTSSAFPEQYDVFKDGVQVAYVRLRHGSLRVNCPDYDGRIAYQAEPNGDGCFDNDERENYLKKIIEAIQAHMAIHS